MEIDNILSDLKQRMEKTINAFNTDIAGVRTNRASTSLLEPVKVNAYGALMPLAQVSSISTPDARTLSVQVWDMGLVNSVEKAISEAGLGLNPMVDGQLIRINLPELSQERRQELAKIAARYSEQAKISIRNIRRDGMEKIKDAEKASEISEDDKKAYGDKVQKITDEHTTKIDEIFTQKEQDILMV